MPSWSQLFLPFLVPVELSCASFVSFSVIDIGTWPASTSGDRQHKNEFTEDVNPEL